MSQSEITAWRHMVSELFGDYWSQLLWLQVKLLVSSNKSPLSNTLCVRVCLSEEPCGQVHPVMVIPVRSTAFLQRDKLHPVPGYGSMWPACDPEACADDFLPWIQYQSERNLRRKSLSLLLLLLEVSTYRWLSRCTMWCVPWGCNVKDPQLSGSYAITC